MPEFKRHLERVSAEIKAAASKNANSQYGRTLSAQLLTVDQFPHGRLAIGKWQRRLQALFKLAEVEGGHAHRFQDTFAVELLLAGVPLERVSVLLGHQSVRITERHYSPCVRARQEQLEQDLKRVWEQDPMALMVTKGTPRVHGKTHRPN